MFSIPRLCLEFCWKHLTCQSLPPHCLQPHAPQVRCSRAMAPSPDWPCTSGSGMLLEIPESSNSVEQGPESLSRIVHIDESPTPYLGAGPDNHLTDILATASLLGVQPCGDTVKGKVVCMFVICV